MRTSSPVVRRRRLGLELRSLREETGLSGEDASKQLGWSNSKLSRIEIGHNCPKPPDLAKMLDLYEVVDQARRDEFVVLLKEAKRKGWWQLYSDIPYSTYIGLEAEATSMLTYQQVILGLFQTEAYARAINMGTGSAIDPDVLEERVEVRMTRQQVLTKDRPLEVRAILDEGSIRRMVGGRDVMREQLTRLLDLMELPNVILQVLPFSVGANPGTLLGPFIILRFDSPIDPGVVYREGDSDPYPDREGDLQRYTMSFDHVRSMALNVADTKHLIKEALNGL